MVSFYLERAAKAAIESAATEDGATLSDTYRAVIADGLEVRNRGGRSTQDHERHPIPPGRVFGGGS